MSDNVLFLLPSDVTGAQLAAALAPLGRITMFADGEFNVEQGTDWVNFACEEEEGPGFQPGRLSWVRRVLGEYQEFILRYGRPDFRRRVAGVVAESFPCVISNDSSFFDTGVVFLQRLGADPNWDWWHDGQEITRMWEGSWQPPWDGLYRCDGTSQVASVDGPQLSRFELGASFDVAARIAAAPGGSVSADPIGSLELPHGTGYLTYGEGDDSSEGFFARLNLKGELVWLVHLNNSNPFVAVALDGARAVFTNSLGNSLPIDLADPRFAV